MKRYFAYNTLARAIRSSTSIADGDAQGGHFNTTYVSNGIGNINNGEYFGVVAPFDDGSMTVTGFVSHRFDFWSGGNNQRAVSHMMNGATSAYRLLGGSAGYQFQYWNTVSGAWVNWGVGWDLTDFVVYTIVINLDLTAGTFEVYVNNLLKASGSAPLNAATQLTEFRHYSPASGSTRLTWSQLMCADYDLRDAHIYSKLPSAEGTYTDGTGTFADVDEAALNDADAVGLTAIGQKHTFDHAAFPALAAGLVIRGLVVNGRLRTGGAVNDGQFKIVSAGVEENSDDLLCDTAYAPRGRFFGTDPATGTTWDKTAADAAEIGLEAI